jgi:hypothetical protein
MHQLAPRPPNLGELDLVPPLRWLCITRIFLNIWESDRSPPIKPPFLHDQFSINPSFSQEE